MTTLGIQLITLLGGDSSLDREKVVFKAFRRLASVPRPLVELHGRIHEIPVSQPFHGQRTSS